MWYSEIVHLVPVIFVSGACTSFSMFLCVISFEDSKWSKQDTKVTLIPMAVALVLAVSLLTLGAPLLIWIGYRIHVKFFKRREK